MADTSNPLAITEIEGRGRGVVATRAIKAGEVLLTDPPPILLYSANPLKNDFCSNCFKNLHSSPSVLTCPNCSNNTLFCGPNCQSKALSSSHTPWVCQALTSIRHLASTSTSTSTSISVDDISDAHFLIEAYNLAATSPSQFEILLSLKGAPTPNPITDPKTLALHSLISSLSPPQSFAGFSLDLTAALLAKDKVNVFGLMEPFQEDREGEKIARAYGIYPNVSFFNHDCLPNAVRFDYVDTQNTDIVVRAVHDISQGREICLSYFEVKLSYAVRQRRLKEDYGFVCDCDRCKVEANWKDDEVEDDGNEDMEENEDDQMVGSEEEVGSEEMEDDFPHAYFFFKFVCSRDNCGGTLAPLPPSQGSTSDMMECNVCGRLRSAEEIEAEADGGENIDEDGGEDGDMVD